MFSLCLNSESQISLNRGMSLSLAISIKISQQQVLNSLTIIRNYFSISLTVQKRNTIRQIMIKAKMVLNTLRKQNTTFLKPFQQFAFMRVLQTQLPQIQNPNRECQYSKTIRPNKYLIIPFGSTPYKFFLHRVNCVFPWPYFLMKIFCTNLHFISGKLWNSDYIQTRSLQYSIINTQNKKVSEPMCSTLMKNNKRAEQLVCRTPEKPKTKPTNYAPQRKRPVKMSMNNQLSITPFTLF